MRKKKPKSLRYIQFKARRGLHTFKERLEGGKRGERERGRR